MTELPSRDECLAKAAACMRRATMLPESSAEKINTNIGLAAEWRALAAALPAGTATVAEGVDDVADTLETLASEAQAAADSLFLRSLLRDIRTQATRLRALGGGQ